MVRPKLGARRGRRQAANPRRETGSACIVRPWLPGGGGGVRLPGAAKRWRVEFKHVMTVLLMALKQVMTVLVTGADGGGPVSISRRGWTNSGSFPKSDTMESTTYSTHESGCARNEFTCVTGTLLGHRIKTRRGMANRHPPTARATRCFCVKNLCRKFRWQKMFKICLTPRRVRAVDCGVYAIHGEWGGGVGHCCRGRGQRQG